MAGSGAPLALADAVAAVLASARALPAEPVPLADAHGLVLATDVRAPIDLPPWDNAGMDGWAVRAADVAGATPERPARLRVTGTIAAGDAPHTAVGPGEAVRIMTGAPVPLGADSVVRVEDTAEEDGQVLVRLDRDARQNVRPRAQDVRAGEVVLAAGTPLRADRLALLAAVGEARPVVHRRPRVALLASGDELVPVERFVEVRAGHRVVASVGHALAALVREAGGEPVDLGIAPDDPDELRRRVEHARGCDLLVTTAGASVGAHDYTRRALEAAGARLHFWRVRIRPGAQLAHGTLDGMPWLGLPGNPVSALVCFELFVRPLLRRQLGHRALFARTLDVTLDEPVRTAGGGYTLFLRAALARSGDGWRARLTGPQGSNLLSSLARADALLAVPPSPAELPAGTVLPALPLGDAVERVADFPFPAA